MNLPEWILRGPFIPGKVRRVLNKTQTVPYKRHIHFRLKYDATWLRRVLSKTGVKGTSYFYSYKWPDYIFALIFGQVNRGIRFELSSVGVKTLLFPDGCFCWQNQFYHCYAICSHSIRHHSSLLEVKLMPLTHLISARLTRMTSKASR